MERQKWEDLKLSMQAGIRCEEPAFWRYCNDCGYNVTNGETAANAVRELCDVDSRSGLNNNPEAAELWRDLDRSLLPSLAAKAARMNESEQSSSLYSWLGVVVMLHPHL
jgi:hypothetical protein